MRCLDPCCSEDDLVNLLTKSGVGCCISVCYVGTLIYADGIVLSPPPTASLNRHTLEICDVYVNEYSIIFNATKSNCILADQFVIITSFIGPKPEVSVDGNLIDFVKHWPHLRHNIVTESIGR